MKQRDPLDPLVLGVELIVYHPCGLFQNPPPDRNLVRDRIDTLEPNFGVQD